MQSVPSLTRIFCRAELDITKKNKTCVECEILRAYSVEDLLDVYHEIGQADLKIELEKHQSSKIPKLGNIFLCWVVYVWRSLMT